MGVTRYSDAGSCESKENIHEFQIAQTKPFSLDLHKELFFSEKKGAIFSK